MSVTIKVYLEDNNDLMATYDTIRLYAAASPTAVFGGIVTTAVLVEDTLTYSLTDSTGTIATWYRYTLYDSVHSVESGQSDPFQPLGQTLRFIRIEAVTQANQGFGSTCSATGTTATLIDATLADTGVDTAFLEGAWLYRPDASAAGDKVRRVKKDGYTAATGTLAIDRAWTNAPANAEVYEIYNALPPVDSPGAGYSWARACRDGLEKAWFLDMVNLGTGTTTRQTRFSLATWPDINENTIRRVFLRTEDSNGIITDVDARSRGLDWQKVTENGALSIDFTVIPPTTQQTVMVEAVRTDANLYQDTDTTLTPVRLAVRATIWQAMVHAFGEQSPQAVSAYREYAAEQTRRHAGALVTV